jgi:xanthine dehydrogenase accessory factor
VASRTRGAAVRESLSVETSALHSPAGLDIGARTPEQVALAILAEVVAVRSQVAGRGSQVAEPQHHCHHHA